jgi:DNA-3-methyladenine glycosylase II
MADPAPNARPRFGRVERNLIAADPRLAVLIRQVGPCRLEVRQDREPFEALVRAIAHQQLHGRAAEAILGRMLALYPGLDFPTPDLLLATEETTLRGCGFSASKIAALRDIADKSASGVVPTRQVAMRLSDVELIERLTSLRGVGRWTVEMLLISSLGRPDILPVDDFGVREGWRLLTKADRQPTPKAMADIGTAWSPHRSTVAWYLWRAVELYRPTRAKPVT